jgi:hypothetical protein
VPHPNPLHMWHLHVLGVTGAGTAAQNLDMRKFETSRSSPAIAALGSAIFMAGSAWAQIVPPGSTFQCVDASANAATSDHRISGCRGPQTARTPTGRIISLSATLSLVEQEAVDENNRKRAEAVAAHKAAVRLDSNLLAKYPNEAAHRSARESALDIVRKSMERSEQRLSTLSIERKPLANEAEFYVGRDLPFKLKLALDSNDASIGAQKSLLQNKRLEMADMNARFDNELDRLRKLWAGVPPGSTGLQTASASGG